MGLIASSVMGKEATFEGTSGSLSNLRPTLILVVLATYLRAQVLSACNFFGLCTASIRPDRLMFTIVQVGQFGR